MTRRTWLTAVLLAIGFCLLIPTNGLAQATAAAGPAGETLQAGVSPAHKYFTDVPLIDQDGKELRLYSDLMKDKVVIINSMFTSCNSVCPPMTLNLQRIQEWLGDRLGKDVVILSLSVDPATDTPQTLKAFAQKYQARPGWHFLTGKKENLELAIRKFGLYADTREDHYTVMLIGNDRTNLWKKALGMARADALIEIVESVLNDRGGKGQ
ncbi:MAG TPA: SCO family protein [Blastocatellia bacterium]|nr:SCO family protein [Blastocatellia bacterium]